MDYREILYKGQAIMKDLFGAGWTVLYCGDEVMFSTVKEAERFIDEIFGW